MQKDFHFYLTYALARKIGIDIDDAKKIAWADQYTDELIRPDLYEIQTQSVLLGNWSDRQIQMSVLIPFHFVPGDNAKQPWVVTPNSSKVHLLIEAALGDVFQFGIALHGLQDTFSHQGFTGWEEKGNACYSWYYIESGIPNVGHAELRAMPDIINLVWTDIRTGEIIDNKIRASQAAKATYDYLVEFNQGTTEITWLEIEPQLRQIFTLTFYDQRKIELQKLSGDNQLRFKAFDKTTGQIYKNLFVNAAHKHLAEVMNLI